MHNSILVQLITISIRLMRAGCSIRVFCTEQLITTSMLVHIERFLVSISYLNISYCITSYISNTVLDQHNYKLAFDQATNCCLQVIEQKCE